MTNQQACWTDADAASKVDCLCLGTGRFLRAVLIPALNKSNFAPALIQTRGTSFFEYMQQQPVASYPVDTVTISGAVVTDDIPCYGAFSLGFMEGEEATWKFVKSLSQTVKIIGVGVTEAGLASAETPAMKQLLELLRILSAKPQQQLGKICVINMDNVPDNGDLVQSYLDDLVAKDQELKCFVQNHVVCLNTMVDRITSSRPDSQGMIPRAEPLPAKALVILDPSHDLPTRFSSSSLEGVVIRSMRAHLEADLALKLRVANGTHTAVAHALALDKHLLTDHLAGKDEKLWMDDYLESLVNHQIIAAAAPLFGTKESLDCWKDWKGRLAHPHFGLSTFFITQNGAAKAGIRWGPTVCNLIKKEKPITVAMVFAYAVLLRWLVPQGRRNDQIFVGWLDGETVPTDMSEDREGVVSYADGLRYYLEAGWYEFKCACRVRDKSVSEWLKPLAGSQPTAYTGIIRDYLLEPSGGDLLSVESFPEFEAMVKAIATLVARMVQGDGIHKMMVEIQSQHGVFADGFASDCSVLVDGGNTNVRTLHYKASPIPADSHLLQTAVDTKGLDDVVFGEVASAQVVDLHTHLLPPSHGPLCLWGIDELLTYHYLVAEYFITAAADVTPEGFYLLNKRQQADLIWKALFIDRSPMSEACRGVLTTLEALGMKDYVQRRDLEGIRRVYDSYSDRGQEGIESFSEIIFKLSGVRYAIMTNIPFDVHEAKYWRPKPVGYPHRYRSALRVDPLLAGDHKTIEKSLRAGGYPVTFEGARQYLRDWCDVMQPEYMMASTPHDFVLKYDSLTSVNRLGVNEQAMKVPGAFAVVSSAGYDTLSCAPGEEGIPSLIHEDSDLLSEVLMKVCEERDLPVALKIGAHRGVNVQLKAAGDGIVAFADAGVLSRLCERFPKVRFLATFLSRNNQQEACVLASKFRNLHVYGCWWYCNVPSIIKEITMMRIEMLGTAFTAQHSDARVLDQLLYKWPHSRAVIANVLVEEYMKLIETCGWEPTRSEIRRDVSNLFGRSYEDFMAKSFV